MLTWTVILIGFVIMLFIIGGVFIHFLRVALNTEDSTTIDKLPKDKDRS
jgi:hypothetical protein